MSKNLARHLLIGTCFFHFFDHNKGAHMKKLLLASAVSAAFAVPTAVFAQAAPAAAPAGPAVPTLDKIFEASGLTVNGYIDAAYQYANRTLEPSSGAFSDRVFDSQTNSFVLHQFGLTVAKQPKEGFGGLVNITAGKDAQVIHSFPETTGVNASMFDLTQAYGQYANGALTVIAGKFTTLAGTEVIASNANTTFSRSILFGAVPFTHTGVRGTYAFNDMFSLTAGVNNGWDQLTDQNKGKTAELGFTLTPVKPLTIVGSYYSGKETVVAGTTTTSAVEGKRIGSDLVVTWTVIDPLTFGLEFLSVSQDNALVGTAGAPAKAKYSGAAFYTTYMFTPKWRGVIRLESFDDKNGFHFAQFDSTGAGQENKMKEATLTVSYLASDSYEIRGEVRRDNASSNALFTQADGSMSKSLLSYAIQGVYKF
jgi:hypothetical protein